MSWGDGVWLKTPIGSNEWNEMEDNMWSCASDQQFSSENSTIFLRQSRLENETTIPQNFKSDWVILILFTEQI